MHWFNGWLSQILRCRTFLFVSICRSCSHISSSSYIDHGELWYLNLRTGFKFPGAPEPPSVIQMICFMSVSGAPDITIANEFRKFTESTMLNNLEWIAQGNRYQHLDSPETDPAQYMSNHLGIERLSRRYRVDVSYPKTRQAYSRLTRTIQLSISSLWNQVHARLRSTLLLNLMVSDLTPHAYYIQRLISTTRFSLWTYNPTSGMPLNCVYPLHITLEWFILLHSNHIFFLPQCFESVALSTQSVICQRVYFKVQAQRIPLGPSLISVAMLD